MNYIEKIIQYMERNSERISIKEVDEVRNPFKVSAYKFNRDFKRAVGSTPRDWLTGRKMELAHKYKSDDPALTIKEVVRKIGWDLTERQFAEIYKVRYRITYGGKTINNGVAFPNGLRSEMGMDCDFQDFLFSPDKKELEEIIFRMVLMSGEYTIRERGELSRTIITNIENTCFRFPFLTFEKEFIFFVFFDPDHADSLELSTVFTRIGDADLCYAPNDKGIYLDLIYNVAINQEENTKKAILESILNWEELRKVQENVSIGTYQQWIYNKHTHPKINKDAAIFQTSQARYDGIIQEFRKEYEGLLNGIHLSAAGLEEYKTGLMEDDEHAIRSALGKLIGSGTAALPLEKLDLLLQLAECPNLGHIEFADYTFNTDKDLVTKIIEISPRPLIPDLIFDYFRAYKEVEDDGEYYGNTILSNILKRRSGIDYN
ncbi:helix-turn-helix domain-containing protein [Chitinophaga barathri]|uniref:AraC family transcriptional regulator n=1 Tax=Chitinophaga barathri TaxID=1647451 RepID=A0A3N4MI31_9BACT|nr:helix-turn-helix domain-containing protein [Chitinophaga barathri]RPD39299.1 AraC family transcriptional regulator [Chitinophaga barathri]